MVVEACGGGCIFFTLGVLSSRNNPSKRAPSTTWCCFPAMPIGHLTVLLTVEPISVDWSDSSIRLNITSSIELSTRCSTIVSFLFSIDRSVVGANSDSSFLCKNDMSPTNYCWNQVQNVLLNMNTIKPITMHTY